MDEFDPLYFCNLITKDGRVWIQSVELASVLTVRHQDLLCRIIKAEGGEA